MREFILDPERNNQIRCMREFIPDPERNNQIRCMREFIPDPERNDQIRCMREFIPDPELRVGCHGLCQVLNNADKFNILIFLEFRKPLNLPQYGLLLMALLLPKKLF